MTLFPSINQVTKFATTHRPVVLQRRVPQFLTVAKVGEVPPAQFIGRIMDVPVIMTLLQRYFPQIQIVVKATKVLPVPFIGRYVDVPVIKRLIM